MVNICMKCDYFKDTYCEKLGVKTRNNSPICEFYIKRRGKRDGCNSNDA